MSHKRAKKRRKQHKQRAETPLNVRFIDTSNPRVGPLVKEYFMLNQTPQDLPDIEQQLIINFHTGGLVTFNFPKSMKLTGVMLGATIQGIMAQCDFKEPSRIQTLPSGTRLVG